MLMGTAWAPLLGITRRADTRLSKSRGGAEPETRVRVRESTEPYRYEYSTVLDFPLYVSDFLNVTISTVLVRVAVRNPYVALQYYVRYPYGTRISRMAAAAAATHSSTGQRSHLAAGT